MNSLFTTQHKRRKMKENSKGSEAIFDVHKTRQEIESDSDEEDFELINEEDFGGKKLTPKVERQLISLLEHALMDKSGNIVNSVLNRS